MSTTENETALLARVKPYLPMTLASVIWGVMVMPSSWALEELDPVVLLIARTALGGLIAACYSLWRHRTLRPAPGEWFWLIFTGLAGVTGNNLCYFWALNLTSKTNVVVIYAVSPVVTILLAHLFLGERLSLRRIVGVLLAVGGVMTLLTGGQLGRVMDISFNAGDLWELTGVFLAALMAVAAVKVRQTPAGIALTHTMLSGLTGAVLIGSVLGFHLPAHLSLRGVLSVAYLGVFSSCLAYGCQQISAVTIGASATMAFASCVPVIGMLTAWLVAGETVTLLQIGCTVLILLGLWLNAGEKS